jgi:hypothetical protein
MQRLRLGRPSRRYLQLILTGVAPIIHAEALLWFPRESELPFCGVGNNLLTEAGCARLIALISREHDWKAEPTYLCNHAAETAWHREFPQIRQLLAIYVADTRPLGWVVAANKGSEKRFRHSDAALLAPFASLVRLYDQSVSQAHEMQQLLLGFARSLTAAVDAKDPRRAGHSERTARIAVEIARQLSLPEIDLGGSLPGWVVARHRQNRRTGVPLPQDGGMEHSGLATVSATHADRLQFPGRLTEVAADRTGSSVSSRTLRW